MTNTTNTPRVLVVEDQKYPLEAIQGAVNRVFPQNYSGFAKNGFDSAKFYDGAKHLVDGSSYDFVFLDHRMPRTDVGDLEETDMDAFSGSLEGIGYGLISAIRGKNPNAVVIGTSSMDDGELRRYGTLDFKLDKSSSGIFDDLRAILAKVRGGSK